MCQSLRKHWKTWYAFDVQHYSCIFFVYVGTILYVSLTVFSFGLSLITFFFSSFGKQESVRTWYAPAGIIPPGRSLEVSSRNYEVLAIKIPNSAEC